MSFLISFGLTNFERMFGLSATLRFDFAPAQVGSVFTFTSIVSTIVQGGLTGPTAQRWGEVTIVRVALLGSAFGYTNDPCA